MATHRFLPVTEYACGVVGVIMVSYCCQRLEETLQVFAVAKEIKNESGSVCLHLCRLYVADMRRNKRVGQ